MNFLKKYSGVTHALAGFWVLLIGAYAGSADFHNAVNSGALQLYQALPHGLAVIASALFAIAGPLWAFYRKGNPQPSDPAKPAGVIQAALVALMVGSLMLTTSGCTQAQKVSVAQEIVNWTPALTSAIDTIGGVVDTLEPGVALIVDPFVAGVNALSPQFVTAANNYLANPTQTNIQVLQGLIVQIQNSVNTSLSLLQALKVSNPASQQKAILAVNGFGTIVNTLLGLIQGISSHAQVAAMSAAVTVHLATVQGVLDRKAMELASERVAKDLWWVPQVSADRFLSYEAKAGF